MSSIQRCSIRSKWAIGWTLPGTPMSPWRGLWGARRAGPPAMAPGVAHLVLEAPTTGTQNREFAIVAEVRDSAGQPLNGVPVEFSVEPDWQKNVSFTPRRPVTEHNGD